MPMRPTRDVTCLQASMQQWLGKRSFQKGFCRIKREPCLQGEWKAIAVDMSGFTDADY